jgi:hypothetical protein
MKDFWCNILPFAGIAAVVFLLFGLGQLMMYDMDKSQIRYEQCIAADKQWIGGSCVK